MIVVKQKYKSIPKNKFYGVRPDREWFRANIMINNKSVYLGIYDEDYEAAEAFNSAYRYLGNKNFIIKNNVDEHLNRFEKDCIDEKVLNILIKKGFIEINGE